MLFSSRNYAVGMAHYQIGGGNRGLWLLMGGYVAVAATVLGLVLYNVQSAELPQAMRGVSTFLLVMEAFGLTVFGSGRIASCIRTDATTNMLESHRLMPVSAWRVVLSYMLGTTSQLLAMLALNALLMLATETVAHVPLDTFFISQMVLAFFVLQTWSFMAMTAFMFKQAMPLMIVGLVLGSIAMGFLRNIPILPALTVLGTPFLGETIFDLSGGAVSLRDVYFIALPAQLAFAALFFIGACRRYRGVYASTFNVGMGVAFLGVWGWLNVASLVGLSNTLEEIRRFMPERSTLEAQITGALVVSAVLLIVPTHALASWAQVNRLTAAKRWLALGGAVAAAMLPVLAKIDPGPWVGTLIILSLHTVMLYAAFRFTRGMSPLASGVLVVLLFIVLWMGPLLIELLRWLIFPTFEDQRLVENYSWISTLSPLGLLVMTWHGDETLVRNLPPQWLGYVFLSLIAALVWYVAERRQRHMAAAVTIPPPSATQGIVPASGLAGPGAGNPLDSV